MSDCLLKEFHYHSGYPMILTFLVMRKIFLWFQLLSLKVESSKSPLLQPLTLSTVSPGMLLFSPVKH